MIVTNVTFWSLFKTKKAIRQQTLSQINIFLHRRKQFNYSTYFTINGQILHRPDGREVDVSAFWLGRLASILSRSN